MIALRDNQPFYICVVENFENRQGIYIEKIASSLDEGLCRLFFRESDVQAYMHTIAMFDEGKTLSIKQVEIDPDDLVEVISNLSQKNLSNGGQGIKIVASAVYNNKIHNLDIFWASTSEVMV